MLLIFIYLPYLDTETFHFFCLAFYEKDAENIRFEQLTHELKI